MSSVALSRNPKYSQKVKRRQGQEHMEIQRFLRGVIILLALILVLELLFHFLIAPHLTIHQVEIQAGSNFPYSNGEILSAAGFRPGSYFFDVEADLMAARIEQLPVVAAAKVQKVFPRGLSISLVQRKPLSVVMVNDGQGMSPAYIDSEGVLFRNGDFETLDLPVISGVDVPAYRDGMQLPSMLTAFLKDLESLRKSNPTLYSLISEVKFIKKNTAEYEVVLYPSQYPVKVRIGSNLSADLMKYIVLVLDVMAGKGMITDIDELDFRTNEVVYRMGRD